MKVLTFSQYFPKIHPKAGQQTYFREKIWAGLADKVEGFKIPDEITDWDWHQYYNAYPKWHTIRAGNRWKVGDKFSPRIWSGKPYASKQIEFAPPIEIKKIWTFEMDPCGVYSIDGYYVLEEKANELLAKNDGLTDYDMQFWFMPNIDKPKEFKGQILCWNESVDYPIELLQPCDFPEVI